MKTKAFSLLPKAKRIPILVRKILFIVISSWCVHIALAQQSPQFSQYLQNSYVINPAITGVEDYLDVTAAYRNQWTGFDGAPRTGTLSINSPLYLLKSEAKTNSETSFQGVGAFIFTDNAGPISQTGFYGSYAYHLKLNSDWSLSMGTFIGAQQFKYDSTEAILLQNPNDPLVQSFSGIQFDMGLGTYLYSKTFFIGLSANNIFDNSIPSDNQNGVLTNDGRINRNYNLLLGSRIELSENWQLVPSSLLRAVEGAPVQWDIATKFVYNNAFWAGAGFRNEDALVALAGLNITKNFLVSYSYDYSLNRFSDLQTGTHEILLSYRYVFGTKKCACPLYSL